MAYTDPATKSNGNVISDTDMNTYIRNNSRAMNQWTPYTVVWTNNTTNPTIGNGHLIGNYIKFEQWCFVEVHLTLGTTTTKGTGGGWAFSLPFQAWNSGLTNYRQLIPCVMLDDAVTWYLNSTATMLSNATTFEAQAHETFPLNWGVNDVYHAQGFYRTN